jgi:hypothetical protein
MKTEPDEFLTDEQFAKIMHVTSRSTLRWRRDGSGPPFIRVGARRVLYSRRAIDTWLTAHSFPHRAAEAAATREQN